VNHLGQIEVTLRVARADRRRAPAIDVAPLVQAFRSWHQTA
jgi:hypothetical protein